MKKLRLAKQDGFTILTEKEMIMQNTTKAYSDVKDMQKLMKMYCGNLQHSSNYACKKKKRRTKYLIKAAGNEYMSQLNCLSPTNITLFTSH